MRAAYIETTGDPDTIQIGDLPDPIVGPSDVLVQVKAVAVNPIDTYFRSGAIAAELPVPYILGCDLAGVVQAVGANVKSFQPGDRVWGTNQGIAGRQGTFAELAAVDQQWLYPTPDNITDTQAAAGALVGITAGLGLFVHGELEPGETLFVNGGSGGVGSMVVQLAKAAGATVITTAGNSEKIDYCQSIGADLVLNYTAADCDDKLNEFLESQGMIDLWWETLREPNLARTIPLMKKRGRIILMAGRDATPSFPLGAFYVNDLSLRGFAMFNATAQEQLSVAETMNQAYAAETLVPAIGKQFSLDQTAAAHLLQEEKTLEKTANIHGKIVLTI